MRISAVLEAGHHGRTSSYCWWRSAKGASLGIALLLEASRLARNDRDWHMLLEFYALVCCLLGDEDGLYDPRNPIDRL